MSTQPECDGSVGFGWWSTVVKPRKNRRKRIRRKYYPSERFFFACDAFLILQRENYSIPLDSTAPRTAIFFSSFETADEFHVIKYTDSASEIAFYCNPA